jgi:hypothetical protein
MTIFVEEGKREEGIEGRVAGRKGRGREAVVTEGRI